MPPAFGLGDFSSSMKTCAPTSAGVTSPYRRTTPGALELERTFRLTRTATSTVIVRLSSTLGSVVTTRKRVPWDRCETRKVKRPPGSVACGTLTVLNGCGVGVGAVLQHDLVDRAAGARDAPAEQRRAAQRDRRRRRAEVDFELARLTLPLPLSTYVRSGAVGRAVLVHGDDAEVGAGRQAADRLADAHLGGARGQGAHRRLLPVEGRRAVLEEVGGREPARVDDAGELDRGAVTRARLRSRPCGLAVGRVRPTPPAAAPPGSGAAHAATRTLNADLLLLASFRICSEPSSIIAVDRARRRRQRPGPSGRRPSRPRQLVNLSNTGVIAFDAVTRAAAEGSLHKIVTTVRAPAGPWRLEAERSRAAALRCRGPTSRGAETKVSHAVHRIDRKLVALVSRARPSVRQLRRAAGRRPALLPGVRRAAQSR